MLAFLTYYISDPCPISIYLTSKKLGKYSLIFLKKSYWHPGRPLTLPFLESALWSLFVTASSSILIKYAKSKQELNATQVRLLFFSKVVLSSALAKKYYGMPWLAWFSKLRPASLSILMDSKFCFSTFSSNCMLNCQVDMGEGVRPCSSAIVMPIWMSFSWLTFFLIHW